MWRSLIPSPVSQTSPNRTRAALDDDPDDIGVGFVAHLMLRPRGDHGKVTGMEFMLPQLGVEAFSDDQNAGTGDGVYDGIFG